MIDLGQNIKDNQSTYTWGGAAAFGVGILVMVTATATAPWWGGAALVVGGIAAAGAAMNADKINASGKLDFSAAPTPNSTTKVAAAGVAPAPAIEQPTRTAALTVESPSATLPRNAADTAVQTGRG